MVNYPTRMLDNQIWFGSGSKINADDIPETSTRFWLTNSLQEISGSKIFSDNIDMNSNNIINVATPLADQDATTKAYVDRNFETMKEPTGFPNRTDSLFNFSGSNGRVFEIEATGATFDYYIHGQKYSISGSSIEIPDTEGTHYIYLNSSEKLVSTTTFSSILFTDNAWVSILSWDASGSAAIYLAEERHGITMDGITHLYLHQNEGTKYDSGLSLASFDADGTGDDATNAQFGYTAGIIWDEDIEHEISAGTTPANIPILYKLGTAGNWRITEATDYPLVYGADYAGTRAAWNELDGSEWKLSEVDNNNFVLTHYFATNDVNYPVIGVCGQVEYGNLAIARAGATTELNSIITSGLPFEEFKAIATVIFQTGNGYDNVPKSRIRTNDEGTDWIDWRFTAGVSSAGGQVNLHSQLTGLNEDDHSQYYNAERLAGVVSGSNHPTSSDLDDVCNNGALTDNTIQISGSLAIDGSIRTNQNIYVNYDGPNASSYLYFYHNTPTGKSLKWDNSESQFFFNDQVYIDDILIVNNDIQSNSDIYVNHDGPGDGYLYFYANGSPNGAYLRWYTVGGYFILSHILNMANHKIIGISTPTEDADAATKLYVDNNTGANTTATLDNVCDNGNGTDQDIGCGNNLYVNYGGPAGDSYIYFFDGVSPIGQSIKWDNSSSQFEFTEALDITTHKIHNVVDPTAAQDASTKNYVDTVSGSIGEDLNNQVLELYDHISGISGSTPTLQQVTDNGNTTDQDIKCSNLYINQDGPNADSYIYFFSGSQTGQHIKWDNTNSEFLLSADTKVNGNLEINGDLDVKSNYIYLNKDGETESFIDFYNGQAQIKFSRAGNVLYFYATAFAFDNKVYIGAQGLDVLGLCQVNSFRIDQTPTGGVPTPDSYIIISCNGTDYKIGVEAV